jgi:hypothetical protein
VNLSGVVVQPNLQKKCPCCATSLEARKVQVKWRKASSTSSTSYMLTDVLYCVSCGVGYYHSMLKSIKDADGVTWTVIELPLPKPKKTLFINPNVSKSKAKTKSSKSKTKASKPKVKTSANVPIPYDLNTNNYNVKRQRAVLTPGSPRSKQDSTNFDSSGLFIHSRASRKWKNYWDE